MSELSLDKKGLYDNKERKRLNGIIKVRDNTIKDKDSVILALTNENEVLEATVKEWERKQREGYSWVILDPATNLIVDGGTVLPYARFIYPQDMPINLSAYHELDSNGQIIENTDQKIKYESEILL